MNTRLKNYGMWISIMALVLTVLVTGGVIDTGLSQKVEVIGVAVLDILVLLGIINNPTTISKGFSDDSK